MIHVQIASQLTSEGVHGVRWVLLEAAEPPPAGPAAEVGAPALPAFAAAGTAPAAFTTWVFLPAPAAISLAHGSKVSEI